MKRRTPWTFILMLPLAAALGAPVSLSGPAFLAGQDTAPAIGEVVPDFTLPDGHGHEHSIADYRGQYVVLEWLNYGCPFVKKHYETGNMQALQEEFTGKGVQWLAVVSSAPGRQGYYEPQEMLQVSDEQGSKASAVLLDPSGQVGRLYRAQTTPHMMVIDPQGRLIYNGAIDDQRSSRPSTVEGAHNYVAAALNESMAGTEVTTSLTPPYG